MAEPAASGSHVIPGRRPVAEALASARELEAVLLDRRGAHAELEGAAQTAGVPVRRVARAELDRLAEGVVHQGAVALAPPFPYVELEALADARLLVVLDGVTDPQNLGAIARTVEQAGGGGLVLPRRRSAHVSPSAEKAAAGALSWLPLAVVANVARAVEEVGAHGIWSVGLDASGPETIWDCPLLDGPVAIVAGSEGRGLARLVTERVDALASVPTRGRLESLNVGVAVALACYEHVRRTVQEG